MQYYIDINCDVGEGVDNETFIMPYISSCNIACGGHAGNLHSMQKVVKLAKNHSVKVGAHPSFPDKNNFGRQPMQLSHKKLVETLVNQINNLKIILDREDVELHHIKPHGALYNMAAKKTSIALSVLEAVKQFTNVKLYVPYNSVILKLAREEHIPTVIEAFADRNYNEDLSLVPRKNPQACIKDIDAVFKHVFKIISEQKVTTINGVEVALKADTFCIHGDHQNAANLVKLLAERLKEKNININKH